MPSLIVHLIIAPSSLSYSSPVPWCLAAFACFLLPGCGDFISPSWPRPYIGCRSLAPAPGAAARPTIPVFFPILLCSRHHVRVMSLSLLLGVGSLKRAGAVALGWAWVLSCGFGSRVFCCCLRVLPSLWAAAPWRRSCAAARAGFSLLSCSSRARSFG